MGFQKIFNGESGIAIRNKLNSMLSELYELVSHIFWHKTDDPIFGKKLTPDTDVKAIELEENNYGLTMLRLKNTNDTENYAGCLIAMKGSGDEYTNTGYFGFFGANYYVNSWAGNAVVATDKKIILSAYGDNGEIIIQTTGGASAPREVIKIDRDGVLKSSLADYSDLIGQDEDFITVGYANNNFISQESASNLAKTDLSNVTGGSVENKISTDNLLSKMSNEVGTFSGTITFRDYDSYVHTIEIDRGVIKSWTKSS